MDGIGLRLVGSLLKEKNLAKLTEFGVGAEDLFGDGRVAIEWVLAHVAKTGDWPTPKVLHENTGIELESEIDSFPYIADTVRRRSLGKKLQEELKDAVELLEKRMPDEALNRIKIIASDVKVDKVRAKVSSYRKSGLERFKSYAHLKASGGFLGITTPWKTLNAGIQGWVNGTLNVIVAMQNVGKAQPIDTPVVTLEGYTEIGNIAPGDYVIDHAGKPTRVLAVHPQGVKKVYEVMFSDGSSTKCCGEHLWEVHNSHNDTSYIIETKNLIDEVDSYQSRISVPICEPIDLEPIDVRLDPYLMGVLLGDGGFSSKGVAITSEDKELINEVHKLLPKKLNFYQRRNQPLTWDICADKGQSNEVIDILRLYGLFGRTSHIKFIPDDYRFGSIEDRISLLQGLLDTDGHALKTNYSIEYCSVSKRLRKDIKWLVQSLGGLARISKHRVFIRFDKNIQFNPFRLSRKAAVFSENQKTKKYDLRKMICDIVPAGEEECVCITVANKRGLYLTNDCIVTHNSWTACIVANECLNQDKNVLFITLEMTSGRMQRRLDAIRYKIPFSKIRDVTLDADEEKDLKEKIEKDEVGDHDIIFADKKIVRRVLDASHLVMEYEPDIVIIDGGYRFEGSGRGEWEQTKKIVADLQAAAESTDIPWVVTTQYGDSHETGKEKKRGPKMRAWGVRYGKEWVINPDVVIGLHQDEDLRLMNMSEIFVLKMRDAAGKNLSKFKINWDQETMSFEEIVPKTFDPATGSIVEF